MDIGGDARQSRIGAAVGADPRGLVEPAGGEQRRGAAEGGVGSVGHASTQLRAGDVEGDGQPLARGEGDGAVPHRRGEEDEPARLRLDRAERARGRGRARPAARRASASPACSLAHRLGQRDVESRADPARRMDVVGMEARAGQPHRPGAGEADLCRAFAQRADGRSAAAAAARCGARPRRRSRRAARESPARSGRRAGRRSGCRRAPIARAAGRARGAGRAAARRAPASEGISVGKVVDADQALVALQLFPARIAGQPPGARQDRAGSDRAARRPARARRRPRLPPGGRRGADGARSAPPW